MWGDGEMGRWGDGEMGRWGDGEMGRWGDGEKYYVFVLFPPSLFHSFTPSLHHSFPPGGETPPLLRTPNSELRTPNSGCQSNSPLGTISDFSKITIRVMQFCNNMMGCILSINIRTNVHCSTEYFFPFPNHALA